MSFHRSGFQPQRSLSWASVSAFILSGNCCRRSPSVVWSMMRQPIASRRLSAVWGSISTFFPVSMRTARLAATGVPPPRGRRSASDRRVT
jgi:hypothetical protein